MMVDVAGVNKQDVILEIGPGFGILTRHLLRAGARVVAVELDRRLAAYLKSTYSSESKLEIIHDDIFHVRLDQLVTDGQFKVVANLPYSVTGLLLRNLLTKNPRPSGLTVMIQKEVAERIVAEPGAMNLLAILAQYYSTPSYIATVPRTVFYPMPEVTTAIVHLGPMRQPDLDEASKLWQLARAAFTGKRKQLHNGLAVVWGLKPEKMAEKLDQIGIDSRLRPQALALSDWKKIAEYFR